MATVLIQQLDSFEHR